LERTDKASLGVTVCLPKDEFKQLFQDQYVAGGRPHLSIELGLLCYQIGIETAFAEPWHYQTILIEEEEQQSVDLRSVTSGRIFNNDVRESIEASPETFNADGPKGWSADRFEQALVRLEACQNKLTASQQRFLLAFVLIVGFLLLARGRFF
jgi:hypothetical protein